MSIAEYRAAKNVLANFDNHLKRRSNEKARHVVEVRLTSKVPTPDGSTTYPDTISWPALDMHVSKAMEGAVATMIADYRAALVACIKTLHVSAVAEACALITEEPPE